MKAEIQDLKEKAQSLIAKADSLAEEKLFDQAIKQCREIILILEPLTNHISQNAIISHSDSLYEIISILGKAYYRLNSIAIRNDNIDEAIRTGLIALPMARSIQNKLRVADILLNLGDAYRTKSEYWLALEQYQQALDICIEQNVQNLSARIIGRMGIAHKELTDYPQALEYFQRALVLNQQLNLKDGIATNILNIGIVYQALSDYTKALESFQQALAIFQEINDEAASAFALSTIGGLHYRTKNYESALELYGRALLKQTELGQKRDAAVARGNMGHAYKSLGDYEKALEYLQQALQESVEIGAVYPQLHWLNGLGDLFSEIKYPGYSPEKAEGYLLQTIALSKQQGIKSITSVAYESLDTLYKQIGEWEKAYSARDNYERLKAQINLEGTQKLIERQEKEKAFLKRENQLITEAAIAQEKEKILNNILPEEITARLIKGENPIADQFECVSILFMDLVGFTNLSARISAHQLVYLLNSIFSAADSVVKKYGLEKIKTIGDAYMAVGGAPILQKDHVWRTAQAALALLDTMDDLVVQFPEEYGDRSWIASIPEIQVRIGLHCGPAAAGVVGQNKFSYDLWGDAVNTASRMESHGEPGRIHVSEEFAEKLRQDLTENLTLRQAQYTAQTLSQGEGFTFPLGEGRDGVSFSFPLGEGRDGVLIPRGEIEIKGKGRMRTYFLERK
jgi:class 3 adenylate cyclase